MKRSISSLHRFAFGFAFLILSSAFSISSRAQDIPRLEKKDGVFRLMRNGKPFLMLSGELHNSTSSTAKALKPALKTARQMGMNSVIATVSWEQIEPKEGEFDFTEIDEILRLAGETDMPLGLIWFAGYKNGESSYAPLWVKQDTKRFPRCRDAKGRNTTTLSPMCEATMEADAKAFAKLMAHLREADTKRLVSIVQVENEMGAFIDIDHSPFSLQLYEGKVPEEVVNYIQKHEKTLSKRLGQQWNENGKKTKGNWKELFGDNDFTKQFFMAWAFARYADHVAEKGKKEYPLPMYVNCWLADENAKLGSYPNSGPRVLTFDIYKATAPHIDLLAPDVYVSNLREPFDAYTRPDNALFIPEVSRIAGPAYYAFGERNALCYAPFGFEECYDDPNLVGEYKVLGELLPSITEAQGTGKMHGFVRQEGIDQPDDSVSFQLGDYLFHVHYVKGEQNAHGLAIQTAKDEFLVAGVGGYITFQSKKEGEVCKIAYAEEVEKGENGWEPVFVLNGDETAHHNMLYLRGRMPLPDYNKDGIEVDAPLYRPSYQRKDNPLWQNRYKVSGIYRIKLYTYPEK